MKILHLIFTTGFAGSERAAADLIRAQIEAGHTVRVLISGQNQTPNITDWLPEAAQRATVWRFGRRHHVQAHLKHFQPDVIHGHLGKACKLLSKLQGDVPTVGHLHMGYRAKQHAALDGLIAVNPQQVKLAEAAGYAGKVVYIPLVLPAHKPATAAEVQALRETYQISQKTLIGSVGRLHSQKNMAALVAGFQQANLGKDVGLVIIGEGEERAALEKLRAEHPNTAPNIYLVGQQQNMAAWYGLLDAYVSTARWESFGLTLVEAMRAGCPILSTPNEGAQATLAGQPVHWLSIASQQGNEVEVTPKAVAEGLPTLLDEAEAQPAYQLAAFNPTHVVAETTAFYTLLRQIKGCSTA